MTENTGAGESLIEKILTLKIGSAESRAAARRLAEAPRRAPNIILVFVEAVPRNDQGELLGPVELNSQTAEIRGRDEKLFRFEGESQEHFQQRVHDALPATGLPGLALLYPRDRPPVTV